MTSEATQTEREFASINESQVQQLRDMIGKPIRSDRPHVSELTADAVRHYAHGIGDRNPRGHGDAVDLFTRHPALAIPNEWGVPEPPERVHWDPDLARRVGVPGSRSTP